MNLLAVSNVHIEYKMQIVSLAVLRSLASVTRLGSSVQGQLELCHPQNHLPHNIFAEGCVMPALGPGHPSIGLPHESQPMSCPRAPCRLSV